MLIFSSSKFDQSESIFVSVGNFFLKVRKTRVFRLFKDYQWQINLWNLGIWHHTPYTYKQEWVNGIYLHCEWLIISFPSFMQSVQDYLTHIFMKTIGFTIGCISKEITSHHCCGLGFCVKRLAKWSAKECSF